jgi:hypothetical protein
MATGIRALAGVNKPHRDRRVVPYLDGGAMYKLKDCACDASVASTRRRQKLMAALAADLTPFTDDENELIEVGLQRMNGFVSNKKKEEVSM